MKEEFAEQDTKRDQAAGPALEVFLVSQSAC
jgi:hypothetical protein